MHGLVSDIATNPSLSGKYEEEIVDLRVRRFGEIVQYGIERGELRPDSDPAFLHELVFGPVLLSVAPVRPAARRRLRRALRRRCPPCVLSRA
jgi:cytochrome c-type biogenesis protein CcmH/NrfF